MQSRDLEEVTKCTGDAPCPVITELLSQRP